MNTTTLSKHTIAKALRGVPGSDHDLEAPAACSDYDLNYRPAGRQALTRAAVLVPLVTQAHEWSVLLTLRTEQLRSHAGQVSFPGGRQEPEDSGAVACALRETHEEIGLGGERIEVAGTLDDYETVTGYLVTPVVGFVSPGYTLALDEFEVADAFEVPLGFLLDPANHQTHSQLRNGVRRQYFAFEYADRYIWGATAGMLMNFYRRLLEACEQQFD